MVQGEGREEGRGTSGRKKKNLRDLCWFEVWEVYTQKFTEKNIGMCVREGVGGGGVEKYYTRVILL